MFSHVFTKFGERQRAITIIFYMHNMFFYIFLPENTGVFLWFPLNFSLHPVLALRHPSGLDHWRRSDWEDPNGSFGDSDSWCATLRCAEAAEVWIWLEHDSLDCLDMFGLEFGYRLVGWFHFGLILMSGDDFFEWQSAAMRLLWQWGVGSGSLSLSHTHTCDVMPHVSHSGHGSLRSRTQL